MRNALKPLGPAPPATLPPSALVPAAGSREEAALTPHSSVPAPAAASPETALVLVVDDEPLIRGLYTEILLMGGYRVTTASDAEEALSALQAARPDAVLLDIMMPGMSGLKALERIRETDPDLPVIIVTANATSEHAIAALKAGAYNFLVKGFTPDLLVRSVRRALAHGGLLAENRRLLQSLQRQVGDLATLNAIAGLFTSTLEVDRVLTLALEQAQQALRAEGSTILLAEEGTRDLVFAVALGEKAAPLNGLRLKVGEGIAGWVAQKGEPLLIKDIRQESTFSESRFFPRYTTRSLMSVPVKVNGKTVGVLNANNKRSGESFDEYDMALFATFSCLVSLALANAQLFQQLTRSVEELAQTNLELHRANRELEKRLQQAG